MVYRHCQKFSEKSWLVRPAKSPSFAGDMFVRSRQRKGTVKNYFNLPLVQQLKQQPDFAGIFVVFPSNNGARRSEMCIIAANRRKSKACLPALQRLFWLTVLVRDQFAAISLPTCILNCSQNCCKHILRGAWPR